MSDTLTKPFQAQFLKVGEGFQFSNISDVAKDGICVRGQNDCAILVEAKFRNSIHEPWAVRQDRISPSTLVVHDSSIKVQIVKPKTEGEKVTTTREKGKRGRKSQTFLTLEDLPNKPFKAKEIVEKLKLKNHQVGNFLVKAVKEGAVLIKIKGRRGKGGKCTVFVKA